MQNKAWRAAIKAILPALAGFVSMTWSVNARAEVDCRTSPWGCLAFGAWRAERGPAMGERVTVIGDSLVQLLENSLAEQLASNGFHAFTKGAGGSSYWHWNVGLIENNQDIGQIVAANGSKHVVLALGANDARVLASGRVTQQDVANQILWGMTRADDTSSGCVILVEPASHGNAAYNQAAAQVRNVIVYLATVRNNQLGSPHFVLADWHTHSLGHEDWFDGAENIHHTALGKLNYRSFITFMLALARNGQFGC
jgi:hypothetical protein